MPGSKGRLRVLAICDSGHDGERKGKGKATAWISAGSGSAMFCRFLLRTSNNAECSGESSGQTAHSARNAGGLGGETSESAAAWIVRSCSDMVIAFEALLEEWNSTKAENEEFWKAPRFALCISTARI